MNPLRSLCLLVTAACLLALASASQASNSVRDNTNPTDWLSVAELESLPALGEISLDTLERKSPEDGASLINKIYHLLQIGDVKPSYMPRPSEIPCYIARPRGQKMQFNLDQLVATAKRQPNFGDEQLTILITGLPEDMPAVQKANKKLVQAFMQRNFGQEADEKRNKNTDRSSSESDEDMESQKRSSGDLVVIQLGEALDSFERYTLLDTEKTGAMLGNILVNMTEKLDVPNENIHMLAQGVAAHVAGAAARQFTRLTGQRVRRITALDPAKIFARQPNMLVGLTRGDADFVDAIHTSAYGMGTATRAGDADFYPNGPSVAMPGTDNVIESSMRATRYFAETVRSGNGRNFPAVASTSLQQYRTNNGNGPRVYMGLDLDYDAEGDFMLQVNSKAPFGKAAPARKQNHNHAAPQPLDRNSPDYV